MNRIIPLERSDLEQLRKDLGACTEALAAMRMREHGPALEGAHNALHFLDEILGKPPAAPSVASGLPRTRLELEHKGYKPAKGRDGSTRVCAGCGELITWYLTPRGRSMPFNPMDSDASPAVSHWSVCPRPPQAMKKDR